MLFANVYEGVNIDLPIRVSLTQDWQDPILSSVSLPGRTQRYPSHFGSRLRGTMGEKECVGQCVGCLPLGCCGFGILFVMFSLTARQVEMNKQGGTCWPSDGNGGRKKDCLCPTNNTCTWAMDGKCDDEKLEDNGACKSGTDCTDCGTCNDYVCHPRGSHHSAPPRSRTHRRRTEGSVQDWPYAPTLTTTPKPQLDEAKVCDPSSKCVWALDGICDEDTGDGKVANCAAGTDCTDCGKCEKLVDCEAPRTRLRPL